MFMQLSLRRFVSFSFYFRWKSRLNLLRVINRLFYFRFRVRIVLRRPQMRRLPGQDLSRDLVNSTRRLDDCVACDLPVSRDQATRPAPLGRVHINSARATSFGWLCLQLSIRSYIQYSNLFSFETIKAKII